MDTVKVIHSAGEERILNCVESDPTMSYEQLAVSFEVGEIQPEWADGKTYQDPNWPVSNQGKTGSCVGWAVADSFLRWYFANETNKTSLSDKFSPRYVWMASKEIDNIIYRPTTFIEKSGTRILSALEVVYRNGIVLEKMLPFHGGLYEGRVDDFYDEAAKFKLVRRIDLKTKKYQINDRMRTYLLSGRGPVVTRLVVDEQFKDANPNTAHFTEYGTPIKNGGHAIALVGYTSDKEYIIRNSWGTKWGDKGFAYASEEYAQAAFTEAYGAEVA